MSRRDVERLREIAEVEFADIVVEAFSPGINELRIILNDSSFVDVWFSLKLQGRYSFHWERRAIDGTIYRHDNAPHRRWEAVSTTSSPVIFITAVNTNVSESSPLSPEASDQPQETFLTFVRTTLGATARRMLETWIPCNDLSRWFLLLHPLAVLLHQPA